MSDSITTSNRDIEVRPEVDAEKASKTGANGRHKGRYRRAVMEPAILLLLMDNQAHGYDLLQQMQALVGDEVCMDPGTLYRLLRSLEEQGLLTSSWEIAERGPNRRTYDILPAGREALERGIVELRRRARFLTSLADEAKNRLDGAASGYALED